MGIEFRDVVKRFPDGTTAVDASGAIEDTDAAGRWEW